MASSRMSLIPSSTRHRFRIGRTGSSVVLSPSEYLAKLEKGNATTPPIDRDRLDGYLTSHLIDPSLLRADRFDDFHG